VTKESLVSLLDSDGTQKIRITMLHQCHNQSNLGQFEDYYKPSLKLRCLIPELSFIGNCKIFAVEARPTTMVFSVTIEFNNSELKMNLKRLKFMLGEEMKITSIF
jgi:hypothetical protein